MELGDAIINQGSKAVAVVKIGGALERAEADMAFRESHEHRAARWGGLVIAMQLFARLDQAEGLGRVHAERLQIGRREDFAHAALEREAAISLT